MPSDFPPSKVNRRRSVRLRGYDYTQAGGYYITIVTLWRDCLFGELLDGGMVVNALGKIVQECWDEIPSHFPNVTIDAFVVMPNHVHGIIVIHDDFGTDAVTTVGARHASPLRPRGATSGSLGAIIGSFKSAVTRRAGRKLNTGNIWQRNYYEHIIRDQTDYERIANYIFANPINWMQDNENPHKPVIA